MSVTRIRQLYLAGLALAVLGVGLILASGLRDTGGEPTDRLSDAADRPGVLVAGIVLAVLAALPVLAALIGALVTAARAEQWVWFVLLLLLPGITLLVYVVSPPGWARSPVHRP